MGRTAASYLVGGALAATASLVLAVPPVLSADPASARGISAVRAEPSADTGVTFEILPATRHRHRHRPSLHPLPRPTLLNPRPATVVSCRSPARAGRHCCSSGWAGVCSSSVGSLSAGGGRSDQSLRPGPCGLRLAACALRPAARAVAGVLSAASADPLPRPAGWRSTGSPGSADQHRETGDQQQAHDGRPHGPAGHDPADDAAPFSDLTRIGELDLRGDAPLHQPALQVHLRFPGAVGQLDRESGDDLPALPGASVTPCRIGKGPARLPAGPSVSETVPVRSRARPPVLRT